MKFSDEGVGILLYYPLEQLRELDLSSSQITAHALQLLPKGSVSANSEVKVKVLMHMSISWMPVHILISLHSISLVLA